MQQQRPRVRRRRSNAWRWIFVIVVGTALGVAGGKLFVLLQKTNTSLGAMFSPPFEGRRFVRILTLGEDNTNRMRSTGRGLSDTVMVAAVDLDTKTVRAISIPRDTRVEISGHGVQKINAAYALGGPELAKQAAQEVLQVPIDYYIKTDIAKLKNIVDLVGGVGIEVEKDMHYTDRRGGLYINLKKGYRQLDGDKALQYVRFRHDTMGDITRIQRQQKFLRALARQMLASRNWVRLPGIVTEIYDKHYVETDLNLKDILALSRLARDVPPDRMDMETVPGAPETIDEISYWVPDMGKTAEIVQRLLEPPQSGTASQSNIASESGMPAKVAVLNGSGTAGVARQVADQLQRSGYQITATGNAASFNYEGSQIIIHNASADGAARIAELIGCTDIRTAESSTSVENGADITVIVGKNYHQ